MKISRVRANNRKARLELTVRSGEVYPFPYSRMEPRPTSKDRIASVFVDRELGGEAVSYVLESGAEGAVHIEHALEYNEDPATLSELLLHRLTVEARRAMETAELSRREVARRLGTSVPQVYRLLDPTNTNKNLGQVVELLGVLGRDVQFFVKPRSAA